MPPRTLRSLRRLRRAAAVLAAAVLAAAVLAAAVPRAAAVPALPVATAQEAGSSVPIADYRRFFAEFLAMRPDSTRTARVERLVLLRDAGRLVLEEGDLWLCTPVAGRVGAAVFTGRATFALAPPTRVERQQLRRFYGSDSLARDFASLVLVFGDGTLAELESGLEFAPGAQTHAGIEAVRECLRYVSDEKTEWLDDGMARPYLDGEATGYFYAQLDGEGGDRLFFEVDPQASEAVILYREPRRRHVGLKRVYRRDEVCRFAAAGADTTPEADLRARFMVERVRLECSIAENLDFAAVATLRCRAREDARAWLRFSLFEKLEVDSVWCADGRAASFHKGKESSQLRVRLTPPPAAGEEIELSLRYHGDLIDRIGDWMFVESSTGWYPQTPGLRRAPFEITFRSPAQYLLASVGERVESRTEGRVAVSRWVSERPIRNATFVLGVFEEQPIGRSGGPRATALQMTGMRDSVSWVGIGETRFRMGGRMEKGVAEDAAAALAFFQGVLGPPAAPVIRVVSIPALGGEAFPGIVRLTWTPFTGPNAAAEDAVFRAHEVAHQWWGVGVDFRTYHDQWLSEGFAQYGALWYLQAGRRDNRSYFAVLDGWRDEILAQGRQRPADAPPLGPVWLGARAATAAAPNDYLLAVYKKGAWVLHMLRNLLLDLQSMDDERFRDLMRDFYARFAGTPATTEDFRRVAERYAGEDLGWFFDQWVYGTDVPTYRFAHRVERGADGRYRVRCRVDQRGVPAAFRMPVPIRVDFADGRFAWMRVVVEGPRTEVELPPMDLEPKTVVFNDLESVLCRVETARW